MVLFAMNPTPRVSSCLHHTVVSCWHEVGVGVVGRRRYMCVEGSANHIMGLGAFLLTMLLFCRLCVHVPVGATHRVSTVDCSCCSVPLQQTPHTLACCACCATSHCSRACTRRWVVLDYTHLQVHPAQGVVHTA